MKLLSRCFSNLAKHPISIGIPVLSVFVLWGIFAFKVITQYQLVYDKMVPTYPFLIIGFVGLFFWFVSSISDLDKPRMFSSRSCGVNKVSNSYPFTYAFIAALFLAISGIVNRSLSYFTASQKNPDFLLIAILIAIWIDFVVYLIRRRKEKALEL